LSGKEETSNEPRKGLPRPKKGWRNIRKVRAGGERKKEDSGGKDELKGNGKPRSWQARGVNPTNKIRRKRERNVRSEAL